MCQCRRRQWLRRGTRQARRHRHRRCDLLIANANAKPHDSQQRRHVAQIGHRQCEPSRAHYRQRVRLSKQGSHDHVGDEALAHRNEARVRALAQHVRLRLVPVH